MRTDGKLKLQAGSEHLGCGSAQVATHVHADRHACLHPISPCAALRAAALEAQNICLAACAYPAQPANGRKHSSGETGKGSTGIPTDTSRSWLKTAARAFYFQQMIGFLADGLGRVLSRILQRLIDAVETAVHAEANGTDAAEHKQTEEELRQANQRLSLILDTTSDGIFGMDESYHCTFLNAAGAAMLGYRPEEFVGKQIHDLIHHHRADGSVYPIEECRVTQAIATGTAVRIEDEYFWRKDGSFFPVSYSVSPKIIEGRSCGAVVVFIDISERKRIEDQEKRAVEEARAAAEANAKFRAFFEQTADYAGLLTPDGTVLGASHRSIKEVCGGQNIVDIKLWECPAWRGVKEIMRMVRYGCRKAATGEVFREEISYYTHDGGERITDLTLAPVTDDAGKIIYIAASGKDVTDRKNVERALQIQTERYRTLFNSIEEAFCIFEVMLHETGYAYDLLLEEANPSFERHTGLSAIPGSRMREILGQFEQNWADIFGAVALTGVPAHFVEYSSSFNRWFEVSMFRVGETQAKKVAVLFKDISEQKMAADSLRASEERYRSLTELSPDAILVELDGMFVYANSAAASLFAVDDQASVLGRSPEDFIPSECHHIIASRRQALLEDGYKTPVLELRMQRSDGSLVDIQAVCSKVGWNGRSAIQMLLRDVSELKLAHEKLRRMSERLKLAIEGTGQGIWDWHIPSNTYVFSGGLGAILAGEDDATRAAVDWEKLVHPEDLQRVLSTFQDALEDKVPVYECEYRLRDKDGRWRWIWAHGVIAERDEKGKPLIMTGTLADITVRKKSAELAWRHANLDALTGLPNRRLFRERLVAEVARAKRAGHPLALLFIDLDGFKQVNDVFGHDAGDLLLMEAGNRLKACVRETDIVARLGGDEFTVILTELDKLGHVEFVCQKILTSLGEPFAIGDDITYVSGSIGVGMYPLDAGGAEELIRKADQAMYAAKRAGKNQFHYFTKSMDDKAHARLHITNELRRALQAKQLAVHYQPVLDLHSGQIVKAEALLRWYHPDFGEIMPEDFIPLAEESGLIQSIGAWVFREAALCCKHCNEMSEVPFQIGVNKSPIEFMTHEPNNSWQQFLAEIGLTGSGIAVEITEGLLLRTSATVENTLLAYQNVGIELALDDFGTGYSSMAYLLKFKVNYVKIDQSFVRDMVSDSGSRAITEAIISMSHQLGKKVIAEGVETEEQKALLVAAGCDYAQGYLFSRAVPEEQLISLILNNRESGGTSAGRLH